MKKWVCFISFIGDLICLVLIFLLLLFEGWCPFPLCSSFCTLQQFLCSFIVEAPVHKLQHLSKFWHSIAAACHFHLACVKSEMLLSLTLWVIHPREAGPKAWIRLQNLVSVALVERYIARIRGHQRVCCVTLLQLSFHQTGPSAFALNIWMDRNSFYHGRCS